MTFSSLIPQIGVMQGRLLPKYKGRYQAHPVGYWQDEFAAAEKFGLSSIEFILDYNDHEINPLMRTDGLDEIKAAAARTGVTVKSVCADYFMEAPLHSSDSAVATGSMQILNKLAENAVILGITDVVIPCVDQSSLKGEDDKKRFTAALTRFLEKNPGIRLNLALETDLGPQEFGRLLEALPFSQITVNYDSGNSASLGYDIKEEFGVYGKRITDLHIKDRLYQGGSVVLGTGNVKWDNFFEELKQLNYSGVTIMQAFRDHEGTQIFKKQLDWLQNQLKQIQ